MSVCFMDQNKVEHVRHVINSDPEFKLAGKFFTKDILLVYGDSKCIVKVRDGIITEINPQPTFMDSWSFFVKASTESWEKFLQPLPPPFFTDLYGAVSRQNFELSGDLESAFAHFWPLTRLLDIFRELHNK